MNHTAPAFTTDTPTPRPDPVNPNPNPNPNSTTAPQTSTNYSQPSHTSPPITHLPTELILQIIQHVPIDHLLDWRLVCRTFHNEINNHILHHHLHNTQLLGYLGPQTAKPMLCLTDAEYDALHLLRAHFSHMQHSTQDAEARGAKPVWSAHHAVFRVEEQWFRDFETLRLAEHLEAHDAPALWWRALHRLELLVGDEGVGSLRWCVRLGHGVFDLAFPLQTGRMPFFFAFSLGRGEIRVAWRDMMVGFLRNEGCLRRLVHEVRGPRFPISRLTPPSRSEVISHPALPR
ncbi:hypothetical protein IAQ61_005424 [Plenodomus lingam]|uniref:uncharacterized protein n=1 Tax=Leptosphaeria maculans TaxID=5022 RepID=UPI00332A8519|nr:hypothetical protein IAQ61_005424 [Plenodomus lingam]